MIRAARAFSPSPRLSASPVGDRHHVLERARHLDADHVAVRVQAERRAGEAPLDSAAPRPRPPRRPRGRSGRPAATSRANDGPESTATGRPGRRSASSSDMRRPRARLEALGRRHDAPRRADAVGQRAGQTPATKCDGTATSTSSAARQRLGRAAVDAHAGGQHGAPGDSAGSRAGRPHRRRPARDRAPTARTGIARARQVHREGGAPAPGAEHGHRRGRASPASVDALIGGHAAARSPSRGFGAAEQARDVLAGGARR